MNILLVLRERLVQLLETVLINRNHGRAHAKQSSTDDDVHCWFGRIYGCHRSSHRVHGGKPLCFSHFRRETLQIVQVKNLLIKSRRIKVNNSSSIRAVYTATDRIYLKKHTHGKLMIVTQFQGWQDTSNFTNVRSILFVKTTCWLDVDYPATYLCSVEEQCRLSCLTLTRTNSTHNTIQYVKPSLLSAESSQIEIILVRSICDLTRTAKALFLYGERVPL